MYFLPRNNKFYSFIVRIHASYRYFVTLGTVIFFLLFWFFFIYTPINNKIMAIHVEIKNLQNQCKQFSKITCVCNTLKQSEQDLRADIAIYMVKENKNYFQSQLLFVLDQMKTFGLSLNRYTADNIIDKEWYLHNDTHFEFIGTIPQVINFFETIQQSKKPIYCTDIIFIQINDKQILVKTIISLVCVK